MKYAAVAVGDVMIASETPALARPEPADSDASIEDVMVAVCRYFEVRMVDLRGRDRHKSIATARHVAMYLCKNRLRYNPSFPEVGRAFGNRDHTTVMSAVRKIEVQRVTDARLRAQVIALEQSLGCRTPATNAPRLRIVQEPS